MKPDAKTWLGRALLAFAWFLPCMVCFLTCRSTVDSFRRIHFKTWTEERRFDRQAWLAKVTYEDGKGIGVRYLRGMMIHDLNRKYEIGKTTTKQIRALLGPPDKRRKDKSGGVEWGYELGSWDSNRSNYLTFYFNSGKVQASILEWDDYDG